MQIDLNLTITAIIALAAIISPVITTLINNIHQSKQQSIQIYEKSKQQTLETFIKSANDFNKHPSNSSAQIAYNTSKNTLFIYFSTIPNEIEKLNPNSSNFDEQLTAIVKKLSNQIKKK